MRVGPQRNLKRVTHEDVAFSATDTSAEIDLTGRTVAGLSVPTVATAATCTFTVATASGGTFRTLTDKDGTAYTVTLTDDAYVYFDPSVFAGVEWCQIVLNASDTTTLTLHYRNME